MKLKAIALLLVLLVPGVCLAQAPFRFAISNVADIPLGDTHNIRISFSYVSGTNWLSAEGLNSLDVGLRLSNAGTVGSISTVNTSPIIGTTIPPADVAYNTGFSGAQAAYEPTHGLFEVVSGYTNIVGFSLFAPGATGVGTGTSTVFIADVRLRGDVVGLVNVEAFVLRPSLLFGGSDGQIYTSTFKDLGLTPADGGFGPTDPGTASFNVVAAVPEPTTWALIILSITTGAGALVWLHRRSYQTANLQLQLATDEETFDETAD